MSVARILESKDSSLDFEAEYIASHLRPADYQEIIASGFDPYTAAMDSWRTSYRRWMILTGRGVVMFGLVKESLLGPVGIVWAVGTKEIKKVKKSFIKNSYFYRNEMLKDASILFNYVDIRNTFSIKWLKWLGFKVEIDKPIFRGPFDMPFYRFFYAEGM